MLRLHFNNLNNFKQGGEVWHWNGASIKRGTNTSLLHNASHDNLNATSPWLSKQVKDGEHSVDRLIELADVVQDQTKSEEVIIQFMFKGDFT